MWLLGKGYTNLLLISTSMILVPYLLIGLFLLKLSLSGEGNGLMRTVALVSSGYGLWLLYAAGVEYLLLSLLLYGPGLLLFLYSRRQLGDHQRLSGRERLLAGITLVSLIPALWSFGF
ncbi:amino acid APC transporter [Shewanella putrefaciens]|nr:amino acid APC transporter [Shewanella putrefaciens]